jgi:hypothetical protein
VDLSDLIVSPGFDSLGNANCDTLEWQAWAAINSLREDAAHLGDVLAHAEIGGWTR